MPSHPQPAPGLIRFTYAPLAESYASRFVRRVAFEPLAGEVAADRVVATAAATSRRWRRRVEQLAEWEIPPAVADDGRPSRRRKWTMINCPSAFARCTPGSRACGVGRLCPYCWTRDALSLWRRVDAALFGTVWRPGTVATDSAPSDGPAGGPPVAFIDDDEGGDVEAAGPPRLVARALVAREIVYRLPDAAGAPRPRSLVGSRCSPGRRNELARFRRLGITGGVDVTRVDSPEVEADAAGPCGGWTVEFRQVMFCPLEQAEWITDNLLNEDPPLATSPPPATIDCDVPAVAYTEEPTRAEVRDAVAWACRYPRVLMNGGRRALRVALAAGGW